MADFRLMAALGVVKADLIKQRHHIRDDKRRLAIHQAEARGSARTINLFEQELARYDTDQGEPCSTFNSDRAASTS